MSIFKKTNNFLKTKFDLDLSEMFIVLLPAVLGIYTRCSQNEYLCGYYQTNIGKWLFGISCSIMLIFLLYSYFGRNGVISAELKAQKDAFYIWGAVGALFLFVLKETNFIRYACISDIGAFAATALYVALVIGIFYKHLCRAIYENEGRMFECTANEKIYIVKVTEINK